MSCKRCSELKHTPIFVETMVFIEKVELETAIARYHERSHKVTNS